MSEPAYKAEQVAEEDEETPPVELIEWPSTSANKIIPEHVLTRTWTLPGRPIGITHSSCCRFKTKAGIERSLPMMHSYVNPATKC